MQHNLKETIEEKAHRATKLSKDAIASGTYLYPVKGVSYFLSNKSLWHPLTSRLLPAMGLSAVVIIAMFVFTYFPQAAILALFHGPLAFVNAAMLVLSESATIITLLSKAFLVDKALIDVFDGVLLEHQLSSLVSNGRNLELSNTGDTMKKLGKKMIKKPLSRFSPKALVHYLMWLPLNLIPVVGTVLFLIVQARKVGPDAHDRYFQLRNFSQTQRVG